MKNPNITGFIKLPTKKKKEKSYKLYNILTCPITRSESLPKPKRITRRENSGKSKKKRRYFDDEKKKRRNQERDGYLGKKKEKENWKDKSRKTLCLQTNCHVND